MSKILFVCLLIFSRYLYCVFFLGIIVPDDPNFSVSDVRAGVGGRRMVDVMDCKTQRALEMPMRDFERYFKSSDRYHVYNVISLEFSKSRLASIVKRPTVVDSLDWIDLVWPQHLKNIQTDQTNVLHAMKYPKVQKYCLMSVAGCYTDYHVDFGGTSVWYHILKGGKIFWLIPPTDENIALYERWTRSGNQGDVFFGDIVSKCQRIELKAGNSLMIPSGWIHAVYTPKDSIVFGGNFLNSFNITMQLKISQLEERLKVPNRFRFPFFIEVLWYAIERYIHTLTGKSFLNDEFKSLNFINESVEENDFSKEHVHLTPFEYKGLQSLIATLLNLYKRDQKSVPEGIADPEKLVEAGTDLLRVHCDDDSKLAITGKPKAFWPKSFCSPSSLIKRFKKPKVYHPPKEKASSGTGRCRRVRCKQCVACLSEDCRECAYCRDMKKYGGPGTMKQTCVKRKCINPVLPASARVSNTDTNGSVAPLDKKDEPPINGTGCHLTIKRAKLDPSLLEENNGEVNKTFNSTYPSLVIPRVSDTELFKYTSVKHLTTCVSQPSHYKLAWVNVFRYLNLSDLKNCKLVCSDFSEWSKLAEPQTSSNCKS